MDFLFSMIMIVAFVLILAALAWVVKKVPFLGKTLKGLFHLFAILFSLLIILILTGIYSALASAIVAGLALYGMDGHFLVSGLPIDIARDWRAIVYFGLTFGILLTIAKFISALILSFSKMNIWIRKTWDLVISSVIVIFGYPLLIHILFTELTVSIFSGLFLTGIVAAIYIRSLFNREKEFYQGRRGKGWYMRHRLLPWIRTGEKPGQQR